MKSPNNFKFPIFFVLFLFGACSKDSREDIIQAPELNFDIKKSASNLLPGYTQKCVDALPYLGCEMKYPEGKPPKLECEMVWDAKFCYIIQSDLPESPPPPAGSPSWSTSSIIYQVQGNRIINTDSYFAPIKAAAINGHNAQVKVYINAYDHQSANIADWNNSGSNVGESFISLSANGHTRVFGFFPKQGINPINFSYSPSAIIDKSGSSVKMELVFSLSSAEFLGFMNLIENNYLGHDFSMTSKSDATLVRDLLAIVNPGFTFSSVTYPNNIGTGIGCNSNILGYDFHINYALFNNILYNGGYGGIADNTQ